MSQPRQDKRPDPQPTEPIDHFREIYQTQADAYHRMISSEDVDGNILPALEKITLLEGKDILDLGSGTGRLSILLHETVRSIHALDIHFPMLEENRTQRAAVGESWEIIQGDMQDLPAAAGSYDIVIAGWAIGHLRFWFDTNWRDIIGRVVSEMARVTRPGGTLIILETLGTGFNSPTPPAPELAEYYYWLEAKNGFSRSEIQTDYLFIDIDQAVESTEFFFGKDLSRQIIEKKWRRLPEWTGIWAKKSESLG